MIVGLYTWPECLKWQKWQTVLARPFVSAVAG